MVEDLETLMRGRQALSGTSLAYDLAVIHGTILKFISWPGTALFLIRRYGILSLVFGLMLIVQNSDKREK